MQNKTLIVHSSEYLNWKFSEDHPTQGRRFINGYNLIKQGMDAIRHGFDEVLPRVATCEELLRVHSEGHYNNVVNEYSCGEWDGARKDLSHCAQLFAGGTLVALDAIINEGYKTAIHLPGAKHHAQRDHSSGFCVFADFAIAADIATRDYGKKVAILDIDAHHGDGTENLTADNPDVMTFSIHEWGIFPGTGRNDDADRNVYNSGLTSETGMGDEALLREVNRFIGLAEQMQPDVIFVAAGADGHAEDPLTHLQYSVAGYKEAARLVRGKFPNLPILIGGAGGYLPDTRTPEVWANFAIEISIN
jgi:acetoin utilization protein AcuC